MKLKSNIELPDELVLMLCNWIDYSIEDIKSYNELTPKEKDVIPEKLFNKYFE